MPCRTPEMIGTSFEDVSSSITIIWYLARKFVTLGEGDLLCNIYSVCRGVCDEGLCQRSWISPALCDFDSHWLLLRVALRKNILNKIHGLDWYMYKDTVRF